MSYSNYDTGADNMFGTNFSALGTGLHPSFSPGPMGTSVNLPVQHTDDLARDEPRNQDTQNASESDLKQIVPLLEQLVALENDRAQRQDHAMKNNLKCLQTVTERQDRTQASVETVRKQLSDMQSFLQSLTRRLEHLSDMQSSLQSLNRRLEQLSLSSNPQYTQGQGARADPLSLVGNSQPQYAPAGQSDLPPYFSYMPDNKLMMELASVFSRHNNGRPR